MRASCRSSVRAAGAERAVDEDDLRELAAEALGEVYLRGGGRRAHGLEAELKDIVDLQFEL
ncbi:hypothetical protein [Streptomyces calvus]|uniref:hypothetical protein n=1 Tax=Streptomyces calvus TaxID=67282 RepID=UPI00371F8C70